MNLEINNLYEIVVKVNEGSGIILKFEADKKCYVLTAYHNIKTSVENNEVIEIFNDRNKPYSKIGKPYNDIENDFALLEIEYIKKDIPIVTFEKNILPDYLITFMGYPDKANGDRKILNGKVIEWNNKTAVNVLENINGSFVDKEKTDEVIVGFSGSGVFKKDGQTLFLIGILKSLPEEDFDYKEISCVPIEKIENFIKTKLVVEKEIKLDSINLLKTVVLSKRDFKKLSNDEGIKDNKERIHYEYFYYSDGNRNKGYIFLGNNITNKNVFKHIKEKINKNKIDHLEIFLVKVKNYNGNIIDKKNDINKNLKNFSLIRKVNDNIHYIDDFIWTNTIESNLEDTSSHQRTDFIDQIIYTENTENIELSLDFFKKELNHQNNPISIIYGSGGVGKTTLCNALEHTINQNKELRKKVFYIKGEKVVDILSEKNQASFEIKSLNDLYTLYKDENGFIDFEEEEFRLNYISGNIIVIIDAIEEIESALGDRFILDSFLNSLKELNENFFSTKIIITTREPFYIKIKEISKSSNIQYLNLLGFTSKDLNNFLIKRYDNEEDKKKVKIFIEDNKLFNNSADKHIIPLFVDWVCKIIERPDTNRSIESEYFLKDIDIDKLLVKLINREIEKQSLGIDIDGMFKFLEAIIIEHNGMITQSDFSEYLEVETGDSKINNYIKNPLFNIENQSIKIKYDVLTDFIKARSLRYKLIHKQSTVTQLLKICFDGKSELYRSIINIIDEEKSLEYFKYQIKYLTGLMRKDDFENPIKKESIKKSISAILYISFEVLIQKKEKAEYTKLLTELYDGKSISYLFIYGDFFPLDFSDITIRESAFINYETFIKCIFPSKFNRPIFSYTEFKNINIKSSNSLSSKLFDCCQYPNSNIQEIFQEADKKEEDKKGKIYKDIVAVCKKIGESKKALKVFENERTIKSNGKVLIFLNKLIDIGLLEQVDYKNEIQYKINIDYYDELPDIRLGDFPPKLREKIDDVFFN
jgi:ssDNA-binding Zn-finger/Zn-ribbon topoisomerase 1